MLSPHPPQQRSASFSELPVVLALKWEVGKDTLNLAGNFPNAAIEEMATAKAVFIAGFPIGQWLGTVYVASGGISESSSEKARLGYLTLDNGGMESTAADGIDEVSPGATGRREIIRRTS